MTVNRLLLVAALVLFILAAILAFGWIGHADVTDLLGLLGAGLACRTAAEVA